MSRHLLNSFSKVWKHWGNNPSLIKVSMFNTYKLCNGSLLLWLCQDIVGHVIITKSLKISVDENNKVFSLCFVQPTALFSQLSSAAVFHMQDILPTYLHVSVYPYSRKKISRKVDLWQIFLPRTDTCNFSSNAIGNHTALSLFKEMSKVNKKKKMRYH